MAGSDDKLSILLVEDDPGDAVLITEMIREQRSSVLVSNVSRLADGLHWLRGQKPDVIFLDMNLPDCAGLPTISAAVNIAPDVPIVVLTGLSDEELGMEAVKMGAQDYLVKSEVDGRLLLRAARYAIERKRLDLELKQANEKLAMLATTDPLTGVCNRRKIEAVLLMETDRSRRYNVPLCLIIFDIDHFKQINDGLGHQAGDQVLKMMADLVSGNIRSTDWFGRWGGEEFMVVTSHKDLHQSARFAEKLRNLIDGLDFCHGLHVTASFGIAMFQGSDSIDGLTARADCALYRAKQNGRNRVEIYTS